jgi:hypothetical protein
VSKAINIVVHVMFDYAIRPDPKDLIMNFEAAGGGLEHP